MSFQRLFPSVADLEGWLLERAAEARRRGESELAPLQAGIRKDVQRRRSQAAYCAGQENAFNAALRSLRGTDTSKETSDD